MTESKRDTADVPKEKKVVDRLTDRQKTVRTRVALGTSSKLIDWRGALCYTQQILRGTTEWIEWMSHMKWRETKQQPSMLPGPAGSFEANLTILRT